MKVLLEILLLLKIFAEITSALDFEYDVITMASDWAAAQHICKISQKFLIPDLGLYDLEQRDVFSSLDSEDFVWMNAKNVEILYPGAASAYIKFAYRPGNSKLTSYLCHNAKSGEINKNTSSTPLSWQEAKKVCSNSGKCTLYNMSTPKQVKGTVSILKKNVTFWIDELSDHKIPDMESLRMKEECLGIIKLSDGTLAYRKDNCTSMHKYICVSSAEAFAPTIARITQLYPSISKKQEPESGNSSEGTSLNNLDNTAVKSSDNPDLSGSTIGGIAGGSVAALIVIVIAISFVHYLRRRWRSRRDYLRSLHRYTQRHASSRRLLDQTMSGSLPKNSCYMKRDTMRTVTREENEECEKRQYAQCQNDVVQGLKTRYAKYPSPQESAALDKLPAYHSMDGNSRIQVLPAYETYDPDLGHLQGIHGYVNNENQPQLSDLEQYDNIPKLPEKTGKVTAFDGLEQYENHSAGNQSNMGKNADTTFLDDHNRQTVSSLDELEQYENYQVPKREKGLFRLFKTNQANKAKKALEEAQNTVSPVTLNDLDEYENFETQETVKKEVKQLDDLDAYENYAVKKF